MSAKEYTLVPESESGVYDGMQEREAAFRQAIRDQRICRRLIPVVLVITLASIMANLYLAHELISRPQMEDAVSKYVRLARDVPTEILKNSTFNHPNRDIEDAAWNELRLRPENGAVALDDSWTEGFGLPHSMRWPWDEHKGVYELLSSHEMHCLHVVRKTINEAHDGLKVTAPRPHVAHCLNLLRETVMCNADDTLLYEGPLHAERGAARPLAGAGQWRMCRDWDKLQAWGRQHSSCYRDYATDPSGRDEFEKYKYCPDGSTPWKVAARG